MIIPVRFRERFSVFTLACHHLLRGLDDPGYSTAEARGGTSACINLFDEALHDALAKAPVDEVAATVADHLRYYSTREGDKNITALLHKVAADILDGADSWDMVAHFDELHETGRALSEAFYGSTTYQVTLNRIGVTCSVEVEYDDRLYGFGQLEPPGARKHGSVPAISYVRAPRGLVPGAGGDRVIVRFSEGSNFWLYVAYPFLFMHEYVSHVVAVDYKSALVSDGWMMHAAGAFFSQNWRMQGLPVTLCSRQGTVFTNKLRGNLPGIPDDGCTIAHDIWGLVGADAFMRVTLELAAFQPIEGEDGSWPAQFLIALRKAKSQDPDLLSRLIKSGVDIRALRAQL